MIDADAIWVIQQDIDAILNYSKCILTPNGQEFTRLVDFVRNRMSSHINTTSDDLNTSGGGGGGGGDLRASEVGDGTWVTTGVGALESSDTFLGRLNTEDIELENMLRPGADVDDLTLLQGISRYLGVAILKKGALDAVVSPLSNSAFEIDEVGAPRRCGGQGDILAGALGVSLSWYMQRGSRVNAIAAKITKEQERVLSPILSSNAIPTSASIKSATFATGTGTGTVTGSASSNNVEGNNANIREDPIVLASVLASTIVRRAAKKSFSNFGRSSTAPQILGLLGKVFARDVDSKIASLSPAYLQGDDEIDAFLFFDTKGIGDEVGDVPVVESRPSDIEMASLGRFEVEMDHFGESDPFQLTEANVEAHNKKQSDSDASSKDEEESSEDEDSSDES